MLLALLALGFGCVMMFIIASSEPSGSFARWFWIILGDINFFIFLFWVCRELG